MTSNSIDEAEVTRAMIRHARTLTVLADSSKLERTALFEVCLLERINRIVTECEPSAELMVVFSQSDVEVIAAGE
jgi:DeoR family glycerol-3-phosphate regulon repressor